METFFAREQLLGALSQLQGDLQIFEDFKGELAEAIKTKKKQQ